MTDVPQRLADVVDHCVDLAVAAHFMVLKNQVGSRVTQEVSGMMVYRNAVSNLVQGVVEYGLVGERPAWLRISNAQSPFLKDSS